MKFKNHNQRKAVMASLRNKNYRQINSVIKIHPHKDSDRDGVVNIKDCKPLNPNKQGFFHDLQMKSLKAKEQRLEDKRRDEQKKLETVLEQLKERKKVADLSTKIAQAKNKSKQAVIDEMQREKRKLDKVKEDSRKAKDVLDNYTFTGKSKKALVGAAKWSEKKALAGAKWTGKRAVIGAKKFKEDWNRPESIKRRKEIAKKSSKAISKFFKSL